jgi:O-antigen/teichoic acid export membrane protein
MTSSLLLIYFTFIGLFGPSIFKLWTGAEIPFDYSLFLILSIAAIAGSLWNQCYILLASINKHSIFSVMFIIVGACLLGTCYVMKEQGYGVLNTLVLLPVAEFLLVCFSLYLVTKKLKTK